MTDAGYSADSLEDVPSRAGWERDAEPSDGIDTEAPDYEVANDVSLDLTGERLDHEAAGDVDHERTEEVPDIDYTKVETEEPDYDVLGEVDPLSIEAVGETNGDEAGEPAREDEGTTQEAEADSASTATEQSGTLASEEAESHGAAEAEADAAASVATDEAGDVAIDDANPDSGAGDDYEDGQEIEAAADAIRSIPEVDPEAWERLDVTERVAALQEVEDQLAALQNRPAAEVVSKDMADAGQYLDGVIFVSEGDLDPDSGKPVDEVLNTTIHEGRHAYQDWSVMSADASDMPEEVAAWKENNDFYFDPELYGYEIYASQPVEVDANRYANQVLGLAIAKNEF